MYEDICAILLHSILIRSVLFYPTLLHSILYENILERSRTVERNREEYFMGNWDDFGSADRKSTRLNSSHAD